MIKDIIWRWWVEKNICVVDVFKPVCSSTCKVVVVRPVGNLIILIMWVVLSNGTRLYNYKVVGCPNETSDYENRADEGRLKFLIMPAVIVEPDLDIPGNNAKTWERPIQMASLQLSSSKLRCLVPVFSPITRIMAVPIRKTAVA